MRTSKGLVNYQEWNEVITKLRENGQTSAILAMENATDKAIGYGYGRMDESITGSYGDIDAGDFGCAYGIQVGRVRLNGHGHIPALREAWVTYYTSLNRKVV